MEKKDLAWDRLGFDYIKTDYRFSATNVDGQWSEGEMITDEFMRIHEGSPALHYSQQCFEGLKAQTAKDGSILLFRPEMNAERFYQTAERLMMPPVPEDLFMKGVEEGLIPADISPTKAYVVASLVIGSIIRYSDPATTLDINEFIEELYIAVLKLAQ